MTSAFNRYRELEKELMAMRKIYSEGADEEEPILEQMTDLWYQLSDGEMDLLNSRGPQTSSSEQKEKHHND